MEVLCQETIDISKDIESYSQLIYIGRDWCQWDKQGDGEEEGEGTSQEQLTSQEQMTS